MATSDADWLRFDPWQLRRQRVLTAGPTHASRHRGRWISAAGHLRRALPRQGPQNDHNVDEGFALYTSKLAVPDREQTKLPAICVNRSTVATSNAGSRTHGDHGIDKSDALKLPSLHTRHLSTPSYSLAAAPSSADQYPHNTAVEHASSTRDSARPPESPYRQVRGRPSHRPYSTAPAGVQLMSSRRISRRRNREDVSPSNKLPAAMTQGIKLPPIGRDTNSHPRQWQTVNMPSSTSQVADQQYQNQHRVSQTAGVGDDLHPPPNNSVINLDERNTAGAKSRQPASNNQSRPGRRGVPSAKDPPRFAYYGSAPELDDIAMVSAQGVGMTTFTSSAPDFFDASDVEFQELFSSMPSLPAYDVMATVGKHAGEDEQRSLAVPNLVGCQFLSPGSALPTCEARSSSSQSRRPHTTRVFSRYGNRPTTSEHFRGQLHGQSSGEMQAGSPRQRPHTQASSRRAAQSQLGSRGSRRCQAPTVNTLRCDLLSFGGRDNAEFGVEKETHTNEEDSDAERRIFMGFHHDGSDRRSVENRPGGSVHMYLKRWQDSSTVSAIPELEIETSYHSFGDMDEVAVEPDFTTNHDIVGAEDDGGELEVIYDDEDDLPTTDQPPDANVSTHTSPSLSPVLAPEEAVQTPVIHVEVTAEPDIITPRSSQSPAPSSPPTPVPISEPEHAVDDTAVVVERSLVKEKVLATERQTVSVVVTPPQDSGTKSATAPPKPKIAATQKPADKPPVTRPPANKAAEQPAKKRPPPAAKSPAPQKQPQPPQPSKQSAEKKKEAPPVEDTKSAVEKSEEPVQAKQDVPLEAPAVAGDPPQEPAAVHTAPDPTSMPPPEMQKVTESAVKAAETELKAATPDNAETQAKPEVAEVDKSQVEEIRQQKKQEVQQKKEQKDEMRKEQLEEMKAKKEQARLQREKEKAQRAKQLEEERKAKQIAAELERAEEERKQLEKQRLAAEEARKQQEEQAKARAADEAKRAAEQLEEKKKKDKEMKEAAETRRKLRQEKRDEDAKRKREDMERLKQQKLDEERKKKALLDAKEREKEKMEAARKRDELMKDFHAGNGNNADDDEQEDEAMTQAAGIDSNTFTSLNREETPLPTEEDTTKRDLAEQQRREEEARRRAEYEAEERRRREQQEREDAMRARIRARLEEEGIARAAQHKKHLLQQQLLADFANRHMQQMISRAFVFSYFQPEDEEGDD